MNESTVRRRRECPRCAGRFTTYEKAEVNRIVIKKDQSKEPFECDKIRNSVRKALTKHHYDTVEMITENVIRKVFNKKSAVITTKEIGRFVLTELKKVDKLAYLRYVSVHKALEDPTAMEKEIRAIT
jgi:transcriptional repressor NrdR